MASAGHTNTVLQTSLDGRSEVATDATNKRMVGDPNGRGEAYVFGIDGDPTTLCYVLTVDKIAPATAARRHPRQPGGLLRQRAQRRVPRWRRPRPARRRAVAGGVSAATPCRLPKIKRRAGLGVPTYPSVESRLGELRRERAGVDDVLSHGSKLAVQVL